VASVTGFLELALVRIHVAIVAFAELHVLVANRPARAIRLVALLAWHLDMQACQRITRLGVVKLLGGHLPGFDVMALGTFIAKRAFVGILVARRTSGGLREKGPGRVLVFDQFSQVGKHVARRVAFFTGKIGVLAFEFVAGQPVIEFLFRRFPADQVEFLAIVFQVAAYAVAPVRVLHLHLVVVAVLVVQCFGDFFVAVDALKGRCARAELVAGVALGGAAEGIVRLGKRARRDLRGSGARGNKKEASGGEHQLPNRPTESLTTLARRPQVRFALAQEFLRLERNFFAAETPF